MQVGVFHLLVVEVVTQLVELVLSWVVGVVSQLVVIIQA
jgi:hypothetical protein